MKPCVKEDTKIRLQVLSQELARWGRATNLTAVPSHSDVWSRHIEDSLQILRIAPSAKRWLDIGSGAGFPGLVIAIQLFGVKGAEVHCVESDKRKCAFLAHVVREVAIPAVIHPQRMEDVDINSVWPIEAITSRAVTSLPKLLELAQNYIDRGAVGIFPQGRKYASALEYLRQFHRYDFGVVESLTDPDSRIIYVRNEMV